MSTEHSQAVLRAAEAMLEFEEYLEERRVMKRNGEGEGQLVFRGTTAFDVMDEYTDDMRLWCRLMHEACNLAASIREAREGHPA